MEQYDLRPAVSLAKFIDLRLSQSPFVGSDIRAELRPVAHAFSYNVNRMACLAMQPMIAAADALRRQSIIELAKRHAAFKLKLGPDAPIPKFALDAELTKLNAANARGDLKFHIQPVSYNSILEEQLTSDEAMALHLNAMTHDHQNRSFCTACDVMFSSIIVGAWTAFEAMAGDLWERAISIAPKILANRVKGPSWKKICDATENTLEMAGKIGKLARLEYEFDSLKKIRNAYDDLFGKHSDAAGINELLGEAFFDAVSAARNVIVHSAGIMDEDYAKQYSKSPDLLPEPQVGRPFPMSGERTFGLTSPVVNFAPNLIVAVDRWLSRHS